MKTLFNYLKRERKNVNLAVVLFLASIILVALYIVVRPSFAQVMAGVGVSLLVTLIILINSKK